MREFTVIITQEGTEPPTSSRYTYKRMMHGNDNEKRFSVFDVQCMDKTINQEHEAMLVQLLTYHPPIV